MYSATDIRIIIWKNYRIKDYRSNNLDSPLIDIYINNGRRILSSAIINLRYVPLATADNYNS